jgi:glucose-6-phosphate 1-epimerase
MTIKS